MVGTDISDAILLEVLSKNQKRAMFEHMIALTGHYMVGTAIGDAILLERVSAC